MRRQSRMLRRSGLRRLPWGQRNRRRSNPITCMINPAGSFMHPSRRRRPQFLDSVRQTHLFRRVGLISWGVGEVLARKKDMQGPERGETVLVWSDPLNHRGDEEEVNRHGVAWRSLANDAPTDLPHLRPCDRNGRGTTARWRLWRIDPCRMTENANCVPYGIRTEIAVLAVSTSAL